MTQTMLRQVDLGSQAMCARACDAALTDPQRLAHLKAWIARQGWIAHWDSATNQHVVVTMGKRAKLKAQKRQHV